MWNDVLESGATWVDRDGEEKPVTLEDILIIAPYNAQDSIVSPDTTVGSPPRNLGQHGRKLWDEVQREYGITDRGGIELLAQACAALDRAEALAAAIAADGSVVYSRAGVPRSHPAVKDELACRAFVVRTLERLGLNVEGVKSVGRPTANLGWTGGT